MVQMSMGIGNEWNEPFLWVLFSIEVCADYLHKVMDVLKIIN